jgi:hypothetical protein
MTKRYDHRGYNPERQCRHPRICGRTCGFDQLGLRVGQDVPADLYRRCQVAQIGYGDDDPAPDASPQAVAIE